MLIPRQIQNTFSDRMLSWAFLLPVVAILTVTALIPLLYGVYLSFHEYRLNIPGARPAFIGLRNYASLFADPFLRQSLRNNLLFAGLAVPLELALGLTLAMLLCDAGKLSRMLTTLLLIPTIIAPVAAGTLWRMMLDRTYGVVNYLATLAGLPAVAWLAHPFLALLSVVMVDVWQFTPFVAILVLSAIKGIPDTVLEAACMDGASPWQVFRHVILPMISPVLVIVIMIRMIDAFKVFDTVFVLTQGGPGNATEMLPNYIYRQGIRFFNVGYTSALAVCFIIAMFLASWIFLHLRNRMLLRSR